MPVLAHRSLIGFAALAGSIVFSGAVTASLAADVPQGQGRSVSASNLNATGNTPVRMIVGAPQTGTGAVSSKGTAIIYERDSKGNWIKKDKLSPTKVLYGQFGRSVSMSLDGTRVVVGAPGDCLDQNPDLEFPQGKGCAYIYKYTDNKWTLSQTIYGLVAGDGAGYAVYMTPDGSKAFVGEPGRSQGKGAVWAVNIATDALLHEGEMQPSDPSLSNFGISISSSKDGEYVVIGGDHSGSGLGGAWVYKIGSDGKYTQTPVKLVGTSVGSVQQQGASVSMNWAGDTIVIGAPADNNYKGSAFVFARNAEGTWEQKARIIDPSDTADSGFGSTVALAADGSGTIVVSEPYYRNDQAGTEGRILTFTKAKNSWEYKLQSTTANSQCKQLGESLALAPNAALLLAGAPGTTNTAGQYTGATCYFEKKKSAWKMKGKPIIAK